MVLWPRGQQSAAINLWPWFDLRDVSEWIQRTTDSSKVNRSSNCAPSLGSFARGLAGTVSLRRLHSLERYTVKNKLQTPLSPSVLSHHGGQTCASNLSPVQRVLPRTPSDANSFKGTCATLKPTSLLFNVTSFFSGVYPPLQPKGRPASPDSKGQRCRRSVVFQNAHLLHPSDTQWRGDCTRGYHSFFKLSRFRRASVTISDSRSLLHRAEHHYLAFFVIPPHSSIGGMALNFTFFNRLTPQLLEHARNSGKEITLRAEAEGGTRPTSNEFANNAADVLVVNAPSAQA